MKQLIVTVALSLASLSAFAQPVCVNGCDNHIPEPGTLALIAGAVVAGLAIVRGRRK